MFRATVRDILNNLKNYGDCFSDDGGSGGKCIRFPNEPIIVIMKRIR